MGLPSLDVTWNAIPRGSRGRADSNVCCLYASLCPRVSMTALTVANCLSIATDVDLPMLTCENARSMQLERAIVWYSTSCVTCISSSIKKRGGGVVAQK